MSMWVSVAYAAGEQAQKIQAAPSAGETFVLNMVLILVLAALFYLLMVRPQQKRMKEHTNMLGALAKGDRVVTSGGLVGRIDKIVSDREYLVEFAENVKVTVLKSSVSGKYQDLVKSSSKPENDNGKSGKDKDSKDKDSKDKA